MRGDALGVRRRHGRRGRPRSLCAGCIPLPEYASYIGGCCGADPQYIAELKKVIDARRAIIIDAPVRASYRQHLNAH